MREREEREQSEEDSEITFNFLTLLKIMVRRSVPYALLIRH